MMMHRVLAPQLTNSRRLGRISKINSKIMKRTLTSMDKIRIAKGALIMMKNTEMGGDILLSVVLNK